MDDSEKVQAQIAELLKKAEELTLQKKPEVIAEMQAKIKAYGIIPSDLFGGKAAQKASSKAGSTVPIKYKHGDATWSGRGRKPKFVEDYLASGGLIDDIAV